MNGGPAGRRSAAIVALVLGLTGAVLTVAGLEPSLAGAQISAGTTAAPTTPPPPATAAPVAPIPAGTAPSSTLPLQTRDPSTHVSAIFPMLSAAGFIVVLLMLALQWFLTRPGRQGWTL